MIALLALALLAPQDRVDVAYGTAAAEASPVEAESRLAIRIEGAEALAGFVRSMHPLLSLESMTMRARGAHRVEADGRHRVEYDEARVQARYDDEDMEVDFQKGVPPAGLGDDKARQMMWFLAAAGRSFTLSAAGEYRSQDPNQDHVGEALDVIALGVVRMPGGAVKEGDTWTSAWKGDRTERNKPGRFAFTQKVRVERIEVRDGRTLAVLAADLEGVLEGEKDPAADEAWTRCKGATRTVLEVGSGRIVETEGRGHVKSYFRNTSESGARQELTLTFEVEGRLRPR
jgi:hypothetical protein